MSESSRQLLSIGVFFIVVVVAILLYAVGLISSWTLIAPVVLVLYGCWVLSLAGMRANKPIKYERGFFGTMALGLCLIAVGGAWFVFAFTGSILYALVVLFLVLGALAIAAALKRK
jgi:hypothetical protein